MKVIVTKEALAHFKDKIDENFSLIKDVPKKTSELINDSGFISGSDIAVKSFNNRVGQVVSETGDYTAEQITYSDSNVKDHLDGLKRNQTTIGNTVAEMQGSIGTIGERVTAIEGSSATLTWGKSLTFEMSKNKPHALIMISDGALYIAWNSGGGVFTYEVRRTGAVPSFSYSGSESARTVTITMASNSAISVLMP